jgi:hypothetical protein
VNKTRECHLNFAVSRRELRPTLGDMIEHDDDEGHSMSSLRPWASVFDLEVQVRPEIFDGV